MFFKRLLCLILFSKQIFPLLGEVIPPEIGDNDPNSLSMFAKYVEWNTRVTNGWEAKLGDVPYQASLKQLIKRSTKLLYRSFCGAVIIAPRKLLSAAHCFNEKVMSNCNKIFFPGQASSKKLFNVHVVAGNLKNVAEFESGGQWRRLAKVQYPKTYDFPKDDIAVVVPKQQFNYNDHVGPIPMASLHVEYEGDCLISGYGRTGPNREDRSSALLLAHVTLLREEICRKNREKNPRYVFSTMNVTNIAKGDSGGPLVCLQTGDPNEGDRGVLVGIASGSKTHRCMLFTRVSYQQSFINSVNSVSVLMYKYNTQSCIAITIFIIYKSIYAID